MPKQKHILPLLWLMLLLLPLAPLAAAEADPARRMWMSGYEAMSQADKSLEAQADLAALRSYEKALDVFLKVQARYPDWNASLLRYRVEYCRKRIGEIKAANNQDMEYLTKEELFQGLNRQTQENQVLQEKVQALEAEVERGRQALERARGEAAAMASAQENLEILRKDREALVSQVRALTTQLADQQEALQKAQRPDPRLDRLQELAGQLQRTQEELARTGRTLEQVAATRDDLLAQSQREGQWRRQAEAREAALRQETEALRKRQQEGELEVDKLRLALRTQEKINADLTQRRADTAESEQEIQRMKGQLHAREEQCQSLQMELLNLQRRLGQAEEAVTRLAEEREQERARSRTSADAVAEQLKSMGRLQQERKELADQSQRLQASLDAQKELLASLEKDAQRREVRIEELEGLLRQREEALREQGGSLAKSQEALQRTQEELRQLNAASQATHGLLSNARDSQRELEEAKKREAAEREERQRLQERLSLEESARQRAEEQLAKFANGSQDALWQARLQEAQSALEAAQLRQGELEAALVRRTIERQSLEKELLALRKGRDTKAAASPAGDTATASPAGAGAVAVDLPRPESPAKGGDGHLSTTDLLLLQGFLRQGAEAEQQGKTEAARWNYAQALQLQPGHFLALKRLGLLASAAGDDAEASGYLAAAMRQNPDDGEVLLALGFAQLQRKQGEWALATLARCAALAPEDPRTLRLFGVALANMGWREAAAVQLKKALALDPQDGEAAFNLAMLGLTRASELDYEARREPAHRQALEQLARQERRSALAWYRQAVAHGMEEDPRLEAALSNGQTTQETPPHANQGETKEEETK